MRWSSSAKRDSPRATWAYGVPLRNFPVSLPNRPYLALQRLHAVSGVVAVGCFLAWYVLLPTSAGRAPAALMWDAFGIVLPLALHAVTGLLLAQRGAASAVTRTATFGPPAVQWSATVLTYATIAAGLWFAHVGEAAAGRLPLGTHLGTPAAIVGIVATAYSFARALCAVATVGNAPLAPGFYRGAMVTYLVVALAGVAGVLRPAEPGPVAVPTATFTTFDVTPRDHGGAVCICPPGQMVAACPVCFGSVATDAPETPLRTADRTDTIDAEGNT